MILVNLLQKPVTPRYVIAFGRLVNFIAGVPTPRPSARIDTRVLRKVFCGGCGSGENWRESCPRCGGYVERLARPEMQKRLRRCGVATKRLMRELEKNRAARK